MSSTRMTATNVTARNGLLRELTNAELKFVYDVFIESGFKKAQVYFWTKSKSRPRRVSERGATRQSRDSRRRAWPWPV